MLMRRANHLLSLFILLVCLTIQTVVASPAKKQINMVVTAAFVSDKGMSIYDDMAAYISSATNWDVKIVSGLSYGEADAMLDKGVIQVGYVCGLPYTHKHADGKYELLAMPIMAMKKGRFADAKGYEDIPGKYYSYTIVRKDSPYNKWADLKGKTYAFNEMSSNSGYNMPRYKLIQLGVRSWQEYFSRVVVSGSHEESIRLVARGMVEASSVDSLVLDYDRNIGDPDALNVKIIEHLHQGGAGVPPVVISNTVSPSIKNSLQSVFLNMHKDARGKAILEKALIHQFKKPDDANYDDIRKMEQAARLAGFVDYKE